MPVSRRGPLIFGEIRALSPGTCPVVANRVASFLSNYVKDNFLTKLVLQDLAISSETRCTPLLAVAMDND